MRYLFLLMFLPFLAQAQLSDEELTNMVEDGFFKEMLQSEDELWVNLTHTAEGWKMKTENDKAVLSFYFNDEVARVQSASLQDLIANRVEYLLAERKGLSTDFILQRQESGEWLVSTFQGS